MRKIAMMAALCAACTTSIASTEPEDPWTAHGLYVAAKALSIYTYHADLSDDQKTQVTFALGWFAGSMNALKALGALSPEQKFICLSSPQTAADTAREYVAYMDSHPTKLPGDPTAVLIDSLRKNHSCK